MTKNKRSYKQLTEKDFEDIKAILRISSITTAQVVNITGRGASTIALIKAADSFDAYKDKIRAYGEAKQKLAEARTTQEIVGSLEEVVNLTDTLPRTTESVEVPRQDTQDTTEQEDTTGKTFFYTPAEQSAVELTRIANALERLADAWEGEPKKAGFFRNKSK